MAAFVRVKDIRDQSIFFEAEWNRVFTPLCHGHGGVIFFIGGNDDEGREGL